MTPDQCERLSAYLRNQVTSTVPLETRPSSITGARNGLFTTGAIGEGEEIFRSDPLITCVDNGMQATVCDYCFSYSESSILPSGQFRQTLKGMAPFERCGRCKVCYYCSKNCQLNAWKRYHRHECPILSEEKDLNTRTRALYRLIGMQKAGLIDATQWDAFNHLETHNAEHLRGPMSTAIVNASIFAAMRADMHIEEIQKIYCAIPTNAMCIKSAEGSVPVLGTTVDLVGSFMNHSCNPTAFVFFEGRQMRVRALRPLRAGEEICQSYADLSSSVFHRQETIKKDYFFKCACARCQDEMKELEEKAPTDVDWLKKLDNAQRRLLDLANNAINHHNQTGMHIEPAKLEADAEKIIRGPFPHGAWPDGMPPLASIHRIFARICKNNDDISGALRYSLKASLTLRERVGDIWVHSLFDTIQIISLLVSLPDQYPILRENSLFSKDDCWNVLHGYLGALKRGATHTFGSDSLYTRAIANWYSNAMLSAGQPHPETRRFRVVYGVSQKRLLGWAGIEESRGVDVLS